MIYPTSESEDTCPFTHSILIHAMRNLAFKIRRIRELKRLTQEDVAIELGISVKTYQRIESGKTGITLDQVTLLAKIFAINVESLINDEIENINFKSWEGGRKLNLESLQNENHQLKKRLHAERMEKERLLDIIERLLEKTSRNKK